MTSKQRWGVWILLCGSCFLIGCLTGLQTNTTLPYLGIISSLFVIVAAAPGFRAFLQAAGAPTGSLILLALSLFAYGIEILGVHTGFPYSSFSYNQILQPFLVAGVPWTTPFGWVPLVLTSYAVARALMSRNAPHWTPLLAVVLLLAFDLVLDPGAVRLGLWTYAQTGWYHAVPWQNFFGWLLSGSIALFALDYLQRTYPPVQPLKIFEVLIGPASLLCFWIGVTLSAKQVLPTLIGCLLLAVFYTLRTSRIHQNRIRPLSVFTQGNSR